MTDSVRFHLRHVRLRLAAWLMGDDWSGVIMRLWLIRERALVAVTKDGRVILAECEALSEALYAPMPGTWTLDVTRASTPTGATP